MRVASGLYTYPSSNDMLLSTAKVNCVLKLDCHLRFVFWLQFWKCTRTAFYSTVSIDLEQWSGVISAEQFLLIRELAEVSLRNYESSYNKYIHIKPII